MYVHVVYKCTCMYVCIHIYMYMYVNRSAIISIVSTRTGMCLCNFTTLNIGNMAALPSTAVHDGTIVDSQIYTNL